MDFNSESALPTQCEAMLHEGSDLGGSFVIKFVTINKYLLNKLLEYEMEQVKVLRKEYFGLFQS